MKSLSSSFSSLIASTSFSVAILFQMKADRIEEDEGVWIEILNDALNFGFFGKVRGAKLCPVSTEVPLCSPAKKNKTKRADRENIMQYIYELKIIRMKSHRFEPALINRVLEMHGPETLRSPSSTLRPTTDRTQERGSSRR
jgi:hypothetical protein